jgi:hypothetical protein
VQKGNIIKFPKTFERFIKPDDELLVWYEDDTISLKRIRGKSTLDLAEKIPDKNPISLEEMDRIVHKVRQKAK